jgi:Kae1-associated kinase Bud32
MKGAEAVLSKTSFLGIPAVEKFRPSKKYRAAELDSRIRHERTKREARLLARARGAGVLCPVVYEVSEFAIRMKFLAGRMLYRKGRVTRKDIREAAKILVALHSHGIIHGDFTPANLMETPEGMAVIDFGLGCTSNDDEDKGTDVVTMKKALGRQGNAFVAAYSESGGKPSVVRMASEIERRARYMERG